MASITFESNGRRTIQFVGKDGKRRSVRLGKVNSNTAEAIKVKVERLVASSITGHSLDSETARWVTGLESPLYTKLASVGLVPQRESIVLGPFLSAYIDGRVDTKASTRLFLDRVRKHLLAFFKVDRSLRSITPGDADQWRLHLISSGLADNTVRRHCGIAKQFFNAACRKELIAANPFGDLPCSVRGVTSKFYFLSRDDTDKILAACPDAQWRLLFALCRYGGLRCPSEPLALTWQHIDWERNRITVPSPKTEHHLGGESRQIPLFPELLAPLREVFEAAPPGTSFVITRYRDVNSNLRTQLNRIIRNAGLKPWPKLFQNLRSTRETELADQFPQHVVCAWIGNSQIVAAKHYLQVTDDHFAAGAADSAPKKAVRNPVQQPPATDESDLQTTNDENEKTPDLQGFSGDCKNLQSDLMGEVGLEPTTSRV